MAINFNNIGSSGVRDQGRAASASDGARATPDSAAPPVNQDRVELSTGVEVKVDAGNGAILATETEDGH